MNNATLFLGICFAGVLCIVLVALYVSYTRAVDNHLHCEIDRQDLLTRINTARAAQKQNQ